MARGYRVTLDASLRVPCADAAGHARHDRGDRLRLRRWSRRASCRPRTPASSSCARRPRPTSPSRPCSIGSASSRSGCAPTRTCCTSTPTCSRRSFNPTLNRGSMFVQLKPRSERVNRGTISDVQNRLRRSLAGIPGIRAFPVPLQNLRIGSRGGAALYQYTLTSVSQSRALRQRAEADRGSEEGAGLHRRHQRPDARRAAAVDHRRSRCAGALRPDHGRRALHALLGVRHAQDRHRLHALQRLRGDRRGRQGDDPRSERAVEGVHPQQHRPAGAPRFGGDGDAAARARCRWRASRSCRPSPSPSTSAPGYTLGEAVGAMRELERSVNMPPTITGQFAGTAQVFENSFRDQPLLIAAAILTIYIVLGILYESFIHPITILSGLPVGQPRRAADAVPVRRGADHHRHDRHHPAGRHRQEERHHDGGLRHRGPIARGKRRAMPSARPACCASGRS